MGAYEGLSVLMCTSCTGVGYHGIEASVCHPCDGTGNIRLWRKAASPHYAVTNPEVAERAEFSAQHWRYF